MTRGVPFRSLCWVVAVGVATAVVGAEPKEPLATPQWAEFGPAAIRRAQAEDRLLLMVLEVPWNEACTRAHGSLWRDPKVLAAIRDGFVPVRVRADLRPDLHARFPTESWPGINLLLPDGSPLFYKGAGTNAPRRMTAGLVPPDTLAQLLTQSRSYYLEDRAAANKLSAEQEQQTQQAVRPKAGAEPDPSITWSIAQQARPTFDPERRYFGGSPRVPRFDLIELMLHLGAETPEPWGTMGLAALDTLSTKLIDPNDGGLQRLALGLDWDQVQTEKLLARNARLLDLLVLRARQTGKKSDREPVRSTARFLVDKLSQPTGAFAAALCAVCPGGRDETVLTDDVAAASAALLRAGVLLDDEALIRRGLEGAEFLRKERYESSRGFYHAVIEGQGVLLPLHLEDLSAGAELFLEAHQVTGSNEWLTIAGDLLRLAFDNLRDASSGALRDVIPLAGAPPPVRRELFPLEANMRMTRALVRYRYLADSPDSARMAGQILRAFSGSFDRVPMLAPLYAQANYEYFTAPLLVLISGQSADLITGRLRRAGLQAGFPFTITRSFDTSSETGRASALRHNVPVSGSSQLIAQQGTERTAVTSDPAAVRGLLAQLRRRYAQAEQQRKEQGAKPSTPAPEKPQRKQ
jgi:uncharacterized protein YyaL (SSP411 family)